MAPAFSSPLQPLLEQRKRVEDEKRQRFALQLRTFEKSRAQLERLMRALVAHPHLDAAIEARRRSAAALEPAIERLREELIVASRDRRIIERLIERRRRVFEEAEARRDALELEDSNAHRHERARAALRSRVDA